MRKCKGIESYQDARLISGFCKKERPLMMLVLKFAAVDDIAERSIAESGWGDGKSIIKLAF